MYHNQTLKGSLESPSTFEWVFDDFCFSVFHSFHESSHQSLHQSIHRSILHSITCIDKTLNIRISTADVIVIVVVVVVVIRIIFRFFTNIVIVGEFWKVDLKIPLQNNVITRDITAILRVKTGNGRLKRIWCNQQAVVVMISMWRLWWLMLV